MASSTRHCNIAVEGNVQGVGFRWAARARARELGVAGFVRNEDDGSVYIEAEAESAALDVFAAWCRQGPSAASVDRVTVSTGSVKGIVGFAIRG
jgi:acylphosphatase